MTSRSGVLHGRQTPRLSHVPSARSSAGQDVIDLAASAGLHLDPWQQHVLRGSLGERPDGSWQSFEVGLIVPRQNGKGAIIEALELAWLFLFDEDRLILHSAHEFKTAREAFLRVRGLIESTPELNAAVRQFYASTGGECGIELLNGKRLRFLARSNGSGRGFSPDKLVLDEAYNLPDTFIDAVLPSTGARPNPQVWYTSSPGDQDIAPCAVLARVRRRGIKGEDDRLAFFEWSVPYDERTGEITGDPADPKLWAIANPSLGIRKTGERIATFHGSLSAGGFAREELGVGNYPADEDGSGGVFGEAWAACASDDPPGLPVAIGVAVSIDRAWASIGACSGDPIPHLGAVKHGAGTAWVVAEAARLHGEYGVPVVVDAKGPTKSLVQALDSAGVPVTLASTEDYVGACADLFDAVEQGRVSHGNYDELNVSVSAAAKRAVGDRWAWARKAGDITMLEAVTLARWAASNAANYDVLDSIF